MKKLLPASLLIVMILLILGGGAVVWRRTRAPASLPPSVPKNSPHAPPPAPVANDRPRDNSRAPAVGLSPAEKAARIERIKRDYDEVRTKAAADYGAAGTSFPGGLNAFLRELALLERELHKDYAAVLTPSELEDLEMRETTAGQLVQRLLGDSAATDEQRRAVFRLQREFDDKFALTFDTTPPTLFARETERQATQEKIRTVLGDALFGTWLGGEGSDYANFAAFAGQQGLPANAALDLWAAKNEFTLRRLEINAQPVQSADQNSSARRALTQASRARVLSILGAGAFQAAGPEILGWLPRG